MRPHLMHFRHPSLDEAHTPESGLFLTVQGHSGRVNEEGGYPAHHPGLLFIALVALALGVMVYVTARAPATTAFLPTDSSMELPWPPIVLAVADNLPTFFHTLGFSLILVWLSGPGRKTAAWVCTGVFIVEAAFELGQHPMASHWLVDHLPQWLSQQWLPGHIGNYFLTGVFDPYDLFAAAIGAINALLLVVALEPERRHDNENIKPE